MPLPVPRPNENLLVWSQANPSAVRQALHFLNLLEAMRPATVKPTELPASEALLVSGDRILLQIPHRFTAEIPAADTTIGAAVSTTGASNSAPYGYTTAAQANAIVTNLNALRADVLELQDTLNALLSALKEVGINT